MTAHEEPTRRDLEDRLVKRIISAGESELFKQYNRQGASRLQERDKGIPRLRKDREIPGLNQLKNLKDLDDLQNLKGAIPDDIIGQFTGNKGFMAG